MIVSHISGWLELLYDERCFSFLTKVQVNFFRHWVKGLDSVVERN